jgi:hypothetical protein
MAALSSSTTDSGVASSSSSSTPPFCELPLPTEPTLHPALPQDNDTNGTVASNSKINTSSRRGKRHRKSLETLAQRRRPAAAANAGTMSWEHTNMTTITTTEGSLEPGRPLALDQVVVPSAVARYEPPTMLLCATVGHTREFSHFSVRNSSLRARTRAALDHSGSALLANLALQTELSFKPIRPFWWCIPMPPMVAGRVWIPICSSASPLPI